MVALKSRARIKTAKENRYPIAPPPPPLNYYIKLGHMKVMTFEPTMLVSKAGDQVFKVQALGEIIISNHSLSTPSVLSR